MILIELYKLNEKKMNLSIISEEDIYINDENVYSKTHKFTIADRSNFTSEEKTRDSTEVCI